MEVNVLYAEIIENSHNGKTDEGLMMIKHTIESFDEKELIGFIHYINSDSCRDVPAQNKIHLEYHAWYRYKEITNTSGFIDEIQIVSKHWQH